MLHTEKCNTICFVFRMTCLSACNLVILCTGWLRCHHQDSTEAHQLGSLQDQPRQRQDRGVCQHCQHQDTLQRCRQRVYRYALGSLCSRCRSSHLQLCSITICCGVMSSAAVNTLSHLPSHPTCVLCRVLLNADCTPGAQCQLLPTVA